MNAQDESRHETAIEARYLAKIERTAVELANLAGAEIKTALGGMLSVRYKTISEVEEIWQDPVSEVDDNIEELIRARLAKSFPEHDIIGEELDERPARDHDFVWAVDPIDGTANFVNGFPLFAATIGVLHRGRPVAGAIWCAASHELRAGVYHASLGGTLCFNGDPVTPKHNPLVRRHLAGVAAGRSNEGGWEMRTTGSAAIEAAFVAAGLLEAAHFERPNIWDVAGGAALVLAAGGRVMVAGGEGWAPLDKFEAPERGDGAPDLRHWSHSLILGRVEGDVLVSGLGQPVA
jgi:myo-inositol-1(or 4)-monophosphatase